MYGLRNAASPVLYKARLGIRRRFEREGRTERWGLKEGMEEKNDSRNNAVADRRQKM